MSCVVLAELELSVGMEMFCCYLGKLTEMLTETSKSSLRQMACACCLLHVDCWTWNSSLVFLLRLGLSLRCI